MHVMCVGHAILVDLGLSLSRMRSPSAWESGFACWLLFKDDSLICELNAHPERTAQGVLPPKPRGNPNQNDAHDDFKVFVAQVRSTGSHATHNILQATLPANNQGWAHFCVEHGADPYKLPATQLNGEP